MSQFESHLHFSSLPRLVWVCDEKIIYCSSRVAFFADASARPSSGDDSMNDTTNLSSESTERVFEFACSFGLNDGVNSLGENANRCSLACYSFRVFCCHSFRVVSVWSPLKISLFIAATNKRLAEAGRSFVDWLGDECWQTDSRRRWSNRTVCDVREYKEWRDKRRMFEFHSRQSFDDKTRAFETAKSIFRQASCIALSPTGDATKILQSKATESLNSNQSEVFTIVVAFVNLRADWDRFVINSNSATQFRLLKSSILSSAMAVKHRVRVWRRPFLCRWINIRS